MVAFGGIGTAFGGADRRTFRAPDRRGPWIVDYLSRMVGMYVATVTAVSVVDLDGVVPEVFAWLRPTAAGVPLKLYWQGRDGDTGPLAGTASG